MKGIHLFALSTLITLISLFNGNSQTTHNSIINKATPSNKVLKGLILDANKQTPLPYTNIYVLHKNTGVISNEKGYFSINTTGLDKADTLCFQYIGYKTQNIPIGQLDTFSTIYLKEEIFNLSEIVIFGSTPDPESIVKNILRNKDSNYSKATSKRQIFIRERNISDMNEINLNYKKSSISELNKELIELAESKMPKHYTSYTDFLGHIYCSKNYNDSTTLKIDPVKTVSLKEKDITDIKEIEQIASIFTNLFNSTKENEYWKIKSGIVSQKIDVNDKNNQPEKDTLKENNRDLYYFGRNVKSQLAYSLLNNKTQWEFLYNTGIYRYTLKGGTRVNGEDVYIIDFAPNDRGKYIGRMYVSVNTYALIRADYKYAPGKTGTDFHFLGIGYTENQFSGSIYFEKKNSTYRLKYFSYKAEYSMSFERPLALLKKRTRLLFDKKLTKIKIGLKLALQNEESVEVLVLNDREISDKKFTDFKQKKSMEIIYVDQFDDKLWEGFSIIEPTKQMREYKKQGVGYE